MKVKDLIEKLKMYNEDLDVFNCVDYQSGELVRIDSFSLENVYGYGKFEVDGVEKDYFDFSLNSTWDDKKGTLIKGLIIG